MKPSVFFIEETKMKEAGKLKFDNFDVFELVRESQNGGGGLALGCVKDLKATWVREGDDVVEALSVDIFLKNLKIRCCIAYGCQESDTEDRKNAFWDFMEEEVTLAEQSDAGFILHMDGNLWAGENIIPGDPRNQNRNGKKFQNFLEQHPNLTVVNSLPLCSGLITRSRNKEGRSEVSVLDFFVVCDRVLPHVRKMKIDENKEFVLTNFSRVKVNGKATDSDHNTQYMDLDLEIENIKTKRKEIFNFKNEKGKKKFKELTSKTDKFTNCFQTNAPLHIQIENWRELLRSACCESFPKIRIRKRKNVRTNAEVSRLIKLRNEKKLSLRKIKFCYECNYNPTNESEFKKHMSFEHGAAKKNKCMKCGLEAKELMDLRNHIISKHTTDNVNKCNKCNLQCRGDKELEEHIRTMHVPHEITEIEEKISSIEAAENRKKILDNFKSFSENPESIQMSRMWKLIKRVWPKFNSHSTAKKNHKGEVISNPNDLKSLLAKEYKERLRMRPVKTEMKPLMKMKSKIFQMKMKLASINKSPEWSLKDLDKALAKLKNNKSRDFEGYSNDIFKENVIGTDLKTSLLVMFNKLKKANMIPKFFNCANITTVPKKGSRLILNNERGIFRVSVIRSILMNMIYESNYSYIDKKLSDCQMGGRRQKSCKNDIFIINGIIHDLMTSKKKKPVVLQFYDYCQMFDSINLTEAISDIYDAGFDNDTLGLVYKANSEVSMAVKTPHGLTDRQTVNNIVLQGDKFGSLLASVLVENIGQECLKAGYKYLYKNILPVGFLGMVDDIVGITEAGHQASQLNAFINIKTAEKNLQFGPSKCEYMIIGKNTESTTQSRLKVDHWVKEYKENTNTGEMTLVEYYGGQIEMNQTNEYKYLGFMISSKGDNMANIRKIKQKAFGVSRKILTKLKSLNLKQYFFECSVILMNAVLRGSILYAADMYYNIKETEYRQIERIEEEYMRKVLRTTKGCPIISLYLALGQTPARFQIMKMRLLFLKYILEQQDESSILKMLNIQIENPTKGDWASLCKNDIQKLDLKLSFEDIKTIKKSEFKQLLNEKTRKAALFYLLCKQGKKGRENKYPYLEMAEYLLPINNKLTIDEKCEMFAVKNSMIDIPANFSSKIEVKCKCGANEDMVHIYECEQYNMENPEIPFEKIFDGNLKQQITVYNKFAQNLKTRNNLKQTSNPGNHFDCMIRDQ